MTEPRIRDQSRRDMIKTLARGAVYASPVIVSLVAPVRLAAQGPSGPMTICDWFPVICMWFGGATEATPPTGQPAPGPNPAPGSQPGPWDNPPPGRRPPNP